MIRRAIAVVAFLLLAMAGQAGAQETTTTSAPVDPTSTTTTTVATTTTALASTTTRLPIETTTSVSVLPILPIIPDPTTTAVAVVVFYENCDAAALVGATNIGSNQPGYRAELDRDGDGVACETGDVSDLTGDDIVVIADEAGLPVTGSSTSMLAVLGAACAALGFAWWRAMNRPRRSVR